jgi:hypothetical protein
MTYCAPFPESAVTNWNENLLNCPTGEWGVDVGLTAGTIITAPFDATVLAWQVCCPGCTNNCYCWGCVSESGCGRLALGYGPHGEAVAFGHIKPLVSQGQRVSCGQQIGVVQQDACGGPHTEFQYFPDGNYDSCASAVDPREYLSSLFNQPSPPPVIVYPKKPTPQKESLVGPVLLLLGGSALIGVVAVQHPALRREWSSRARHDLDHAGSDISRWAHTARRKV